MKTKIIKIFFWLGCFTLIVSFGDSYLHSISDNLYGGYEENLTKEQSMEAMQHRSMFNNEHHLKQEKVQMEQENSSPEYLYKIVSAEQWQESLIQNQVVNSSLDKDFIHLAKEEQVTHVAQKFWNHKDYMILKLASQKLVGCLVYETNPGGTVQYYHLYEGSIPLDAVVDITVVHATHNE